MLNKACYDGLDIIVKPKDVTFITRSGINKKPLDLNQKKIREQLRRIGFICPYNKETKYEYFSEDLERYSIPYMNYIYYYEFYKRQRIPTFEEFLKSYLYIYCDQLNESEYRIKPFFDNENFKFNEKQLMGRVFRSYNSFHREIELLFQLASYDGVEIKYSFQNDLRGIDFIVDFNGKKFGLASYVNTSRSNNWKQIKNTLRHDYSDIEMIDIVANISGNNCNCDSCNGIYVYKNDFVASKYFEMIKRTEN